MRLIFVEMTMPFLDRRSAEAFLRTSSAAASSYGAAHAFLTKVNGATFEGLAWPLRRERRLVFAALPRVVPQRFHVFWRTVHWSLGSDVELAAAAAVRAGGAALVCLPFRTTEANSFVLEALRQLHSQSLLHQAPVEDWVPDNLLQCNRELALLCAQKGVKPYGSADDLWVEDKEISTTFLRENHGVGRLPQKVYERLRAAFGVDFVLDAIAGGTGAALTMIPFLEADIEIFKVQSGLWASRDEREAAAVEVWVAGEFPGSAWQRVLHPREFQHWLEEEAAAMEFFPLDEENDFVEIDL